ncbi:hypothetical protein CES85_3429 (plasmid) [Ochrobactrum quorumnocens]|uniref:Uncharacterized protein n=1 Tax=Ochrobactrum quorumnocens TaxID=271865 RepID=A0A248UM48_9HYPH|nr:hypothetical protein [[Ochrobactrum] quorumnocens]ASV87927.1 hypothetical protein CES85_3429 [[Ochrobactrum] quorumnocens]
MIGIDIDSLDEATLTALNRRIVERLQFLHQQKTAAALQAFAMMRPASSGVAGC